MKTLYIACASLLVSMSAWAQTFFNCDFNSGIPSTFTLIDNDGNDPSADMKMLGFKVGVPWVATTATGDKNMAACSTSWYAKAGQSDDWMITPPISISTANAVLTWSAKAGDKRFPDGYAVYVSENGGNTIEAFDKTNALFSVDKESTTWADHEVDLSMYNGKTISLAFVNNSNNMSRLYIDDIYVGQKVNAYINIDMGPNTPYGGQMPITGEVYTKNAEPVNGYTIGLEYDDKVLTQQFDQSLTAGSKVPFVLDAKLPIDKLETKPYKVWVEANGTRNVLDTMVTAYPRKVVCEDVTGTWCAWCVRGIVALDRLRADEANWTIGLATHCGDVMADNDYLESLQQVASWSGLPAGVVNRSTTCDPADFLTMARKAFNDEPVMVGMQLEATRNKVTNEVEASTTLRFTQDDEQANYRVAYVVVENRIHQPDNNKYCQMNAYAGGANGEMGGYENLPSSIPASQMYFDDVVRGCVNDFRGIWGSVPSVVKAGKDIVTTVQFSLPDNVINAEETELVALLVDQSDNHVVNAEKVALGEGSQTGISNASISNTNNRSSCIYSPSGMKLEQMRKGLNIVRKDNGNTVKVLF